ncbi:uracil phosphoribosyltransferase [Beauveria brongniartii RCEF 3172]|uniref:Uracil phosphoribosyltransferase n=1 Tax=Beauveria brongniartii RCEF 3172 TaxID=1081107 RepID=A0A166ZBC8_9HYPO|nr:uracil phosphoribosyltransferase [Beauveria brongniartii RCEF 3172]
MPTPIISQASIATTTTKLKSDPVSDKKPIIIGLYGLPGSGKSSLMNRLKLELDDEKFVFHKGSELISAIVAGGLAAFAKLDKQQKRLVRERAIASVAKECLAKNRSALVVGHYMFWPEGELAGDIVATANDFCVYTHMIYLNVPVHAILNRRLGDTQRHRPPVSAAHLEQWQRAEIDQLAGLCRQHCILFSVVPQHDDNPLPFILNMVRHFEQTNARRNLALVMDKVEAALVDEEREETVLVVDADKTLASEDAGSMFWQAANGQETLKICPLKSLFSSPLGYSEAAFRQATLLYEEAANEVEFEALCDKLASAITVHPEFISLFRLVLTHRHVRVVVLTCGIRRVWQTVLDKVGLGYSIKVVGGGRIADEIVVTPEIKAQVVSSLRQQSGLFVWAFGDGPLDLPMLEAANKSVVVSGDPRNRSRSMEDALCEAIDTRGFCSRQVLLPPHVAPRLDATKLPLLAFSDAEFVEALVCRRGPEAAADTVSKSGSTYSCTVFHATDTGAAQLLMSPTRDASVAGAALRLAHQEAGKYLALHFLTAVIGVESFNVPHVQGHQTAGFRLAHEPQTTIIALMRGGEPMALGISQVFPRAMFLHAFGPDDIKDHHLENQKNLVLVDSVVNSGQSITDFLRHVAARLKQHLANIVIVAGVVQKEAIADGHALRAMMEQHRVNMVALRVSSNKFTGTKSTDTGNRLFNTTHLA